jgi:hypothetical protein
MTIAVDNVETTPHQVRVRATFQRYNVPNPLFS